MKNKEKAKNGSKKKSQWKQKGWGNARRQTSRSIIPLHAVAIKEFLNFFLFFSFIFTKGWGLFELQDLYEDIVHFA